MKYGFELHCIFELFHFNSFIHIPFSMTYFKVQNNSLKPVSEQNLEKIRFHLIWLSLQNFISELTAVILDKTVWSYSIKILSFFVFQQILLFV